MKKGTGQKPTRETATKDARLAAALKANIAKRKAQAQARGEPAVPDKRPDEQKD